MSRSLWLVMLMISGPAALAGAPGGDVPDPALPEPFPGQTISPGAELHFDFGGLVPQSKIVVTIRGGDTGGGAFLSLLSEAPPEFAISANELSFTAPTAEQGQQFVGASIVVGAYLQRATVIGLQANASASVGVRLSFPAASIFLTSGHSGSIPLEASPPFNCFEAGALGLLQSCQPHPVTHLPLIVAGPITGRFYCCRHDPFPP